MREAGLAGRHRRRGRRTTVPDPHAAARPDLIGRDFAPGPAPVTRRCGDIAYLATEQGRLFLAIVIDIATRRIVGWATADHLRTDPVADALRDAVGKQRPTRGTIWQPVGIDPGAVTLLPCRGHPVREPPGICRGQCFQAGPERFADELQSVQAPDGRQDMRGVGALPPSGADQALVGQALQEPLT